MRQTQRKMINKFEYHQPYLVIYHTIILMKQFYLFYLFNAQTRMQTRYIYKEHIIRICLRTEYALQPWQRINRNVFC